MGTKYIVELEDGEHLYKTTINALGNPVMRSAEKVPYTEPDLERVKKTAYDDGYSAGCQAGREDLNRVMSDVKQIKKEAYEYTKYLNKSYEDGLNDAWEAARKIVLDEWDNGIKYDDFYELFNGKSCKQVLNTLAAAEVIEKLQAYERAQLAKLRDRLTAFCMKHHCTNCPLNTDDFNCGKGLSFKPCYEGDKDIIPNDELEIYATAAGLA